MDQDRWTPPRICHTVPVIRRNQVLYKYCSPLRLDMLENRQLAFCHGSVLNDIFEMKPLVTFNHEERTRVGRHLPVKYQESKTLPETTQEEDERNAMAVLDAARVLCLSESWDIIPMWSYYAQSHEGFVVGMNAQHSYFQNLRPVVYSTTYPCVDYDVAFEEAVFHKFDQWQHEREWRCVRFVPGAENVYLCPYPPDPMSEVVPGHRSLPSSRDKVIACLEADVYKHVQLFQAEPDSHAWRIERRELLNY